MLVVKSGKGDVVTKSHWSILLYLFVTLAMDVVLDEFKRDPSALNCQLRIYELGKYLVRIAGRLCAPGHIQLCLEIRLLRESQLFG